MPPVVLALRTALEPLDGLLAAHGVGVAHVPCARRVAVETPPPRIRPGEVLLVTSAATPRHCPGLPALAARAETWAVGPATEAALRAVGIVPARVGDAGGAALVAALGDRPATFVGARRPAADTAAAIEAGRLRHWVVYDRVSTPHLADRLQAVSPLDAVVLTSPSQARALGAVAPELMGALPVACIGPTTAAAARQSGARELHVASRPGLAELAALVAELVEG